MRPHPRERELALLAGNDLSWWTSLRLRLHVRSCGNCANLLRKLEGARAQVRALGTVDESLPDTLRGESWERLAVEMEANIRLGLSAGECVTPLSQPDPPAGRPATVMLVAYAAVILMVVAGLWLSRPPGQEIVAMAPPSSELVVFQSRDSAVEVQQGNRGFGLVHEGAGDVQVLLGAEGSVGARYVDSETGQMMIHHVVADQ